MAERLGIYKCERCGNIAEVIVSGKAPLVCCGEEMLLMEEQKADRTVEKHVPFVEETENGYVVKVGENEAHPMTDKHYIQWIELLVGGSVLREELNPGDAPSATFFCNHHADVVAREYCNIHGHWSN